MYGKQYIPYGITHIKVGYIISNILKGKLIIQIKPSKYT